MSAEPAVRVQPPPPAVLLVVNPVMRRLLRSRLAGALPASMAVLELTGRRSGRQVVVPVGVHDLGEQRVVFTGAPWRLNFEGGRAATVQRGTSRRTGRGLLVSEPEAVADALAEAIDRYGARNLAIRAPRGHEITRDDLVRLRHHMVRLDLDD